MTAPMDRAFLGSGIISHIISRPLSESDTDILLSTFCRVSYQRLYLNFMTTLHNYFSKHHRRLIIGILCRIYFSNGDLLLFFLMS